MYINYLIFAFFFIILDLGIDGRWILKWALMKSLGGAWTRLMWLGWGTWWASVNMVMNLQVQYIVWNF
jgi:hypothetical protein